jgi:predicted outer membrane repeat protein
MAKRFSRLLACLAALVLPFSAFGPPLAGARGAIYYAKPGGGGNCANWAEACELQTALAQALPGDQIWAARGVYYPDQGASQVDNQRSASFFLKAGVAVYGGFASGESSLDARNWQVNPTVLSGDLEQNDLVDFRGVTLTTTHIVGANAYQVVRSSGLTETARLDGFTITGGAADGPLNFPYCGASCGGGLENLESSPSLANLVFIGNRAALSGGGMTNRNSSPALWNVTFSNNLADYGGGMANAVSSSPSLQGVVFSDNQAVILGGGMYNGGGSPGLEDVTFVRNQADVGGGMCNENSQPGLLEVIFLENHANGGGGMANMDGSAPSLEKVTFTRNQAGDGGGMYNDGSSPRLEETAFDGNTASSGGGMCNRRGSQPLLSGVTFTVNQAHSGGGIFSNSSSPRLANVTFGDNRAAHLGGGMATVYGSPILVNVRFRGNQAASMFAGGGGMANEASHPLLANVVFSGNLATGVFSNGGAMFNMTGSSPVLSQVTFSGNQANEAGGAIYNQDGSHPQVANSLLWGNLAAAGAQVANFASSVPTFTHTSLQGAFSGGAWDASLGIDGGGNLDADPQFVRSPSPGLDGAWGTADDDFGSLRLQVASPAVDAGQETRVISDTLDLDGDGITLEWLPYDLDGGPRFFDYPGVDHGPGGPGYTVDLGAYETRLPTLTTLVSSGSPLYWGQPLVLTATVSLVGGLARPGAACILGGGLDFTEGEQLLASLPLDAECHAVWYTASLPPGQHILIASYTGDDTHGPSDSPPLVQQINARFYFPLIGR